MDDPDTPDKYYAKRLPNSAIILDGAEGYFDQHAARPELSTNSISQLPSLSSKEYVKYYKLAEELSKTSGKADLKNLHRTQFSQWEFELSQDFNLVFYGLGSKREMVLSFVEEQLDADQVLVVNGYNPATSIQEVLELAAGVLLNGTRPHLPKAIPDLLALIMKSSKPAAKPCQLMFQPKLVLVIHSIDGESLRTDRAQSALSTLASHSDVHIVATVDYINAPMLWDSAKLSSFNFLWHNATTFESYTAELSFFDPLTIGGGSRRSHTLNGVSATGQGSAGMRYVLESLTSNARGLYRVLISNQLQAIEDVQQDGSAKYDPAKFGVEFKTLYQLCSEEFIVTNELNFRTMLTEFYEHEMLISTKGTIGTELIYAPFDKNVLERLLEDNILNE
ncbi:origin recognition complex, subunit 2 [Lipomyces arxii]|uniref:origin recognition complex, subunit 2 n=1 Tax=Lipomyces arxii TaxID=56418 RepID=UPI0034CF80DD